MEAPRKNSKKRAAILACLQNTKTHPTAEWIYQQLKPQIPDLSLGTVYRNLSLFRAEGQAISVGTFAGLEHFDARTEPHSHFVCTCCQSVLDADDVTLSPAQLQTAQQSLAAQVDGYQLTFFGRCRNCMDNGKSHS